MPLAQIASRSPPLRRAFPSSPLLSSPSLSRPFLFPPRALRMFLCFHRLFVSLSPFSAILFHGFDRVPRFIRLRFNLSPLHAPRRSPLCGLWRIPRPEPNPPCCPWILTARHPRRRVFSRAFARKFLSSLFPRFVGFDYGRV